MSDSKRPPVGDTPMSDKERQKLARKRTKEARDEREREIFFLASAAGHSSESLARQYGLTRQGIDRILKKRIQDVRVEGWEDVMRVRTLRVSALRLFMPGWFNKTRAEARDEEAMDGKALQSLLRIYKLEAKYLGIEEKIRVTLEGGDEDKSRMEVHDQVMLALQQQLRLVMGALQKHPAALDAVIKALRSRPAEQLMYTQED